MGLRLRTVLERGSEEQIVELPDGLREIRIGRRQDLELPLPFASLSSVHARLACEAEGSWSIEDLGSRNGTELDGARLAVGERRVLTAGGRIGFGDVTVIFDGPVPDDPRTPISASDGTGTIARRLVNAFFAGEPGAGVPTLTVLGGAPPATLRLESFDRRYVVGRVEDAALQIVAEEISREHAAFTRSWAGVSVLDLGSKNGLRVNGTRTATQQLHDGDEIVIGPVTLRLSDPADLYLRSLEADAAPPVAPEPAIPARQNPVDAPEADAAKVDAAEVDPAEVDQPARPSRGTRATMLTAAVVLVAICATAIALALGG